MQVEIKNHHQLVSEVFANPDKADENIVAKFTEHYPYLNAFWFIRARLAIVHEDKNADFAIQKAALYFSDPDQLTRFLYKPILHTSDDFGASEVPFQTTQNDYIEDIYLDEETITEEKKDEQNMLTQGNSKDHEINKDQGKPSRYNDDLMPYTFLWWLQKTRSEYSDTYQPYTKPDQYSQVENNVASSKEDLLDQQIRENIFHLQSPEQKLSSPFGGETIPFQVAKKENSIIERFIKEEPHIKPPSAEKISLENKARQSAEDESGFVSETLAIIYAEQGLYHKAIETYRKLSLKFPEKSPYFASRIKELTNKIN